MLFRSALASRACLRDGRRLLQPSAHALSRLALRLRHAIVARPREGRLTLEKLAARLDRLGPVQSLARGRDRRQSLDRRLALAMSQAMRRRRERTLALAARLESVSPEQALARGYSITLDAQGQPIRDAATVPSGTLITTRLQRGELRSRTEGSR